MSKYRQRGYMDSDRESQPAKSQRGPQAGTVGDPRKASAALGELGVELIVSRTVDAIKAARARR